jgi:hypothetical protein
MKKTSTMNKFVRLIAGAIIGIALSTLTASATDVDILGQNGWVDAWGSGAPDYATDVLSGGATPLSGNAVLKYEKQASDPGQGVQQNFATPLTGKVDITFNLYIPADTTGSFFLWYGLYDSGLADVSSWGGAYANPPPGSGYLQIEEWNYSASGPALTRGVWQAIKIAFDFDAGTLQYFKDGVAVGSAASLTAAGVTATSIYGFGYPYRETAMGTPWSGAMYFDNFSVVNNGTTIWSDNFDNYIPTTVTADPNSLISVDFIYSDLNNGPSSPYSGDTVLTGTLDNNAAGLIFIGQTGPWNALDVGGNNASAISASLAGLKNGGGVATTISIALGQATTSGAAGGDWRNNYVATTGGNLREEQAYLYNGVITGDHFDWEFAGLVPNAHYMLTAFGSVGGLSNVANGVPGAQDSEGDWNWSDITASAAGRITGRLTDTANTTTPGTYGFQLYKLSTAIPLTANAGSPQTVSAATPSVTIGGSPTASGGTGPYTYSWSPSTGLSDATAANPTASPTTTTTYTVTVTDSLSATATSSVIITYLTANEKLISVDFVEPGGTPCSDDTVLTGTATMLNAAGTIFSGQIGSWNPLNIGTYSMSSAISGLLNNGAGTATTVKLALGLATGLDATAAGGWRCNPNEGAPGGATQLRDESAYLYNGVITGDHYAWAFTGLVPGASYTMVWFGDLGNANGASNDANGVAGIRDNEGDWNWDSVAADASGTISGMFTAPNPTLGLYGVQIEKLPAALSASAGSPLSLSPGTPSGMIGGSPTAIDGTAPYTYSWSPSTGLSSTTVANPTVTTTAPTTTYTVTVTDSASATATASVVVTYTVPPLLVSAGPARTVSPGSPSATIGGSPTASGGSGSYTYSWSPNGSLSSGTVANPIASPTSTTTYTVTVTDSLSTTATASVIVTYEAVATGYAAYISGTTPVGWWGMNEAGAVTTTADLSGAYGAANNQAGVNLPLTYQGVGVNSLPDQAGFVSGAGNRAAYLDGTSDSGAYGHGASAYDLNVTGAIYRYEPNGFAIETWVKADGVLATDCERFVSTREFGLGIQIVAGAFGNLQFTTFGKLDYFSTTPMPSDGLWHQIGVSWDGATGTASFYIDGVPAGTMAGPTGLRAALSPGANTINLTHRNTDIQHFKGWVDELVIWGSPRSDADFAASYAAAIPAATPTLTITGITGSDGGGNFTIKGTTSQAMTVELWKSPDVAIPLSQTGAGNWQLVDTTPDLVNGAFTFSGVPGGGDKAFFILKKKP